MINTEVFYRHGNGITYQDDPTIIFIIRNRLFRKTFIYMYNIPQNHWLFNGTDSLLNPEGYKELITGGQIITQDIPPIYNTKSIRRLRRLFWWECLLSWRFYTYKLFAAQDDSCLTSINVVKETINNELDKEWYLLRGINPPNEINK